VLPVVWHFVEVYYLIYHSGRERVDLEPEFNRSDTVKAATHEPSGRRFSAPDLTAVRRPSDGRRPTPNNI